MILTRQGCHGTNTSLGRTTKLQNKQSRCQSLNLRLTGLWGEGPSKMIQFKSVLREKETQIQRHNLFKVRSRSRSFYPQPMLFPIHTLTKPKTSSSGSKGDKFTYLKIKESNSCSVPIEQTENELQSGPRASLQKER